jgi:hypothetical protein
MQRKKEKGDHHWKVSNESTCVKLKHRVQECNARMSTRSQSSIPLEATNKITAAHSLTKLETKLAV